MRNPLRLSSHPARGCVFGLLLAAALPALAQTAAPADAAAKVDPRWVWDLSVLYPSDAAWNTEREAFVADLPKLRALRGTLGRDAASLRQGLDQIAAANLRLQRLFSYASNSASTDNRNARNQERVSLMRGVVGQYGNAVAWLDPEIQALGADKVAAYQKAEAGLAPHAARLRQVLRQTAHTLSPDTEAALAAVAPLLNSSVSTRTLLVTSDIDWPTIRVGDKDVKLDETGYTRLREHPDRAVRKQVFDVFWKKYGQYENSFGSTLAARVESGTINAKLRHYPSAVAASLDANAIPETVYRTLVAETNSGLPTLHRYLKLRQKMLKLPDLHYYDVYAETGDADRRYTAADSLALTIEATKPLGDEYQALLKQALSGRQMHVYPAPGKSSGAYMSGLYGFLPFVFLNHQDNYASLSTFAHEWGHGLHSMLAQRSQPATMAGYPLYLAEIASMTNEVLLADYMMKQAKSRADRLFVLGRSAERLRGGFFRQAMFAEFELATHDAVERGEALSGKKMTQIYCGLLRKYHGADSGVMAIDPQYCQEWAYIPHFYRPFYVYAYATSIVAATYFGESVLEGQPGARDRYLNVLRSGGSLEPHPLLLAAGLDMASPAPYQRLVKRMNAIIDEMETLLGEP